MTERGPLHFAVWSGASTLAVGVLLVAAAAWRGDVAVRWSLLGWILTTVAGVGGGAWIVSRHGTRGAGFLGALVVCMIARVIFFVAGPFAAAPVGAEAVGAVLVGLFAGYVPAQAVEIIWFAKNTPGS